MSKSRLQWFYSLIGILYLAGWPSPVFAAKGVFFALKNPGQGSIFVSNKDSRAFLTDLGGPAEDEILLDGVPLLEALDKRKINTLVITCSHPHADHLKGIERLIGDLTGFVKGTPPRPRFKQIFLIDSGYNPKGDPKSLSGIWEAALSKLGSDQVKKALPPVYHRDALGKNAFRRLTSPADELYVFNIPYKPVGKHPHSRSVVVVYNINKGQHVVVDFDDASNAVVNASVVYMQDHAIAPHTVVLPHHGSDRHDILPILNMKPRSVIITANKNNRYGHPGLNNVAKSIESVGIEHVHFIGSDTNLVLANSPLSKLDESDVRANIDTFIAPLRRSHDSTEKQLIEPSESRKPVAEPSKTLPPIVPKSWEDMERKRPNPFSEPSNAERTPMCKRCWYRGSTLIRCDPTPVPCTPGFKDEF